MIWIHWILMIWNRENGGLNRYKMQNHTKNYYDMSIKEIMKEKVFYLLIVGSRNFHDYELFCRVTDYLLQELIKHGYRIVIISGGAKGADSMAEQYAKDRGYDIKVFKADWNKFGKSAGYIRNREMHQYIARFEKKACLCFWSVAENSSGTRQNFELAMDKTPLEVYDFRRKRFLTHQEISDYS